jgi:hypothetical protein
MNIIDPFLVVSVIVAFVLLGPAQPQSPQTAQSAGLIQILRGETKCALQECMTISERHLGIHEQERRLPAIPAGYLNSSLAMTPRGAGHT